ncbi:MAG: NUDIX domain-containing protein [Clostridia bacterium]|nr:NUDIX domain-containing protein [Clostridia bacterium]
MSHCQVCGTLLEGRELEHEGIVPFCPRCGEFRFPMYNVAVSMIVINEENRKTLLVKQYGKDFYRLVAGYVNRTEPLEHAVVRELKEETGMTAVRVRFNRTQFFEPSNTLMCNFTAFVKDDSELSPNYEIDSWAWFSFDEARKNVNPEILAGRFLNACLDDLESSGGYPAEQA